MGRFRCGMIHKQRPVILPTWRITTSRLSVAEAVAMMFGGQPEKRAAGGGDHIQVVTNAPSVEVLVEGSKSVQVELRGSSAHVAAPRVDGRRQSYSGAGGRSDQPRKPVSGVDCGRGGHGATPHVSVLFRLAQGPELGEFRFVSSSWCVAAMLGELLEELQSPSGVVRGCLEIERATVTDHDTGKRMEYYKPTIHACPLLGRSGQSGALPGVSVRPSDLLG
ncbi:hypothetical protein ABZ746_17460 [Streptomyces sp. NPDC020096]